jgi:phosphoglycolate phosphatase
MRSTLILFDIDGTLVGGSAESIEPFARAIRDVYGIAVGAGFDDTAGKTDRLILRELLEREGVTARLELEARLLARYLKHVQALIRKAPGQVLPGVRALLERLEHEDQLVIGLGTGNLEQAARLKLRLHGLNGLFGVGGFGDDALQRRDVIAAGIQKAAGKHGVSFERIAVVGDTPRDIDAAKANGVHSIAVASGSHSASALKNHGASVVLEDMTGTEIFMRELQRLSPTPRVEGA